MARKKKAAKKSAAGTTKKTSKSVALGKSLPPNRLAGKDRTRND